MQILTAFIFLLFTCIQLSAQVPVSKEPHHHQVLENNKVRILNVLVPPGDTTQYHIHSTPSLFVCFTVTHTGDQRLGQSPTSGTSTAGNIWFENLAAPHIKIHRVMNLDRTPFHVMDIELLYKDSGFNQPPLKLPHTQVVLDNAWARAYKINLPAGEEIQIPASTYPHILVAISDANVKAGEHGNLPSKHFKEGEFLWINPSRALSIANTGQSSESFALYEIR